MSGPDILARATARAASLQAAAAQRAAKLRANLARAMAANWWDTPAMAAPPTITGAYDFALTNIVNFAPGSTQFNFYGGVPTALYGGYVASGSTASLLGVDRVEFATDAPKLMIRSGAVTAVILVEGVPISRTGVAITGAGTQQAVLDWGGVVKPRVYEVIRGGGSAFYGVITGPLYRVWAPRRSPPTRIAFEGDSYLAGTGASLTATSMVQVASALLGCQDPWVIAVGGTGWLNAGTATTLRARIASVIASNPDGVVIAAGTNDTASSAAAVQAEVTLYLQTLRAALPVTPVVVLGCWPKATGPSAPYTTTENAIAAGVAACNDPLTWFQPVTTDPGGPWQFGTGRVGATAGNGNSDFYIGADGAHPNDAGHEYLGRRMAAAVIRGWEAMGVV